MYFHRKCHSKLEIDILVKTRKEHVNRQYLQIYIYIHDEERSKLFIDSLVVSRITDQIFLQFEFVLFEEQQTQTIAQLRTIDDDTRPHKMSL